MVVLHYPWGPAWPQTRRFCASSVPAHRPTLRFSRDILVPTTGVCESCSLSGASPSIGSCAPRPEQLQVYRSVKFCASSSRSVIWRTFPLKRSAIHHPVCLKNSPPESRWATSPPRKMALGPLQASHWPPKCPLRSGPAGCASLIEVFNHRRTFAALLRLAAQGANTLNRAIGVPNQFTRQILTNSCSLPFHLPKTGEIVVLRSVFRKDEKP